MPAPTIDPLPDAPSRLDSPSTFTTDADAFVAALPDMVTQINAVAVFLASLESGTLSLLLAAIDAAGSGANKLPYYTGSNTVALADLTSVARTLIAQTTQALMRTAGLGMSANGSSLVAAADYAAMVALLGLLRPVAFFFTTTPTSSEVLGLYAAVDAFTIPANMAGSQVKVGTNATATFDIDVQQNGSTIGTISIATSGTATLTTTSGVAKSIAAGDVLKFVAPGSADATIANVAITVKGTL